jgi:hypothetical protein
MTLTYGGVFAGLCSATLERETVTLVLETLGSNEALDARSLGVWLRTLLLGLDLTTNDEFTNLEQFLSANDWSQTQPMPRGRLAKRSRGS